MTPTISGVWAREILDSGGRPTVEVDLELTDRSFARASVPAGTSTGRHEARELRDDDPARFEGEGVLGAVQGSPRDDRPRAPRSKPVRAGGDRRLPRRARRNRRQVSAGRERGAGGLDGRGAGGRDLERRSPLATPRRRQRSAAADGEHHQRRPPRRHEARIPGLSRRPVGAETFREALECVSAVRTATGAVLREHGFSTLKAAEGGFAPPLPSPEAALDLLVDGSRTLGPITARRGRVRHRRRRDAFLRRHRLSPRGRPRRASMPTG